MCRGTQDRGARGFTLIELSIVIIIIGLLIGGILVAQSIITTAKVNKLVNQLQKFDVAVTNFHTNYRSWPGDSSVFTAAGNNDGSIGPSDGMGGNDCFGNYYNQEAYYVYSQLSEARMLDKKYTALEACVPGAGVEPYKKAANADVAWPYTDITSPSFGTDGPRYPIIAGKGEPGKNFYFDFYVLPQIALALENKMGGQTLDDDVPPYISSHRQVGLTNVQDVGNCLDETFNLHTCGSSSASYAEFMYFVAEN